MPRKILVEKPVAKNEKKILAEVKKIKANCERVLAESYNLENISRNYHEFDKKEDPENLRKRLLDIARENFHVVNSIKKMKKFS